MQHEDNTSRTVIRQAIFISYLLFITDKDIIRDSDTYLHASQYLSNSVDLQTGFDFFSHLIKIAHIGFSCWRDPTGKSAIVK
jgi:hypothetical protein